MKKIILLIDCSSEFDRRLLRGLVKYTKEHDSWLFCRMSSLVAGNGDQGQALLNWAREWKADAIVGRWRWGDPEPLASLRIPVVLQNYVSRSSTFSNLTGDYIGTGTKAARFFFSREYRDFAYFGIRDVVWSEERLQGFREEIGNRRGRLYTLMVDEPYREQDRILQWVRSLPKPIALFACDDAYALFLSELCKLEGVMIPEDISLLGVDNDELLCLISDPQISSIELNVEQGGYRLGEELDKQFLEHEIRPRDIIITPGEIVLRNSTRKHDVKDPYVEMLVREIDDRFDQFCSTEQLLDAIPLSRRSMEIRFKKEMGMTIYRYLLHCRLQRFAKLLATTDMPMSEIADRCGSLDYPNISRSFKKIFGCTPKDYRLKRRREEGG